MAQSTWHGKCALCDLHINGNLAHWHHLMGHLRRGEMPAPPLKRGSRGKTFAVADLSNQARIERVQRSTGVLHVYDVSGQGMTYPYKSREG